MESMLSSYHGFHHTMIPEAVEYELETAGSHDYELPADFFSRFEKSLTVLKLHAPGSPHNIDILRQQEIPYLVMYRDLRDVAVSYYFYVRRTPWHPDYPNYRNLDVEEGLLRFARTLLPEYVQWIRRWRKERDEEKSRIVRYEDLLKDTESVFRAVTNLYNLKANAGEISRIVEAHRFNRMSGGRGRGNQDRSSFFRKGVSGDWKKHFTSLVTKVFKEKAGQALVDFGYEEDENW
jgi:hypothetical protein